jgi:hypothetical protein
MDSLIGDAFGETFRKAGPGCSALLFAGAKKLAVCWVLLTLRAGGGESVLFGGMVPGGRETGTLRSRGGAPASSPFADASAARVNALSRVSLPVSFDAIVLASKAAVDRWAPDFTSAAWKAWWEDPFPRHARAVFDPASGLADKASSIALALARKGPSQGLSAAVVRQGR